MTALDLTADAEQYREIAADFVVEPHSGFHLLWLYATEGIIERGLSFQVRELMTRNASTPARNTDFAHRAATALTLGRLLGHVSTLEDRMNAEAEDAPAID